MITMPPAIVLLLPALRIFSAAHPSPQPIATDQLSAVAVPWSLIRDDHHESRGDQPPLKTAKKGITEVRKSGMPVGTDVGKEFVI
jgi:hypothetical protein